MSATAGESNQLFKRMAAARLSGRPSCMTPPGVRSKALEALPARSPTSRRAEICVASKQLMETGEVSTAELQTPLRA